VEAVIDGFDRHSGHASASRAPDVCRRRAVLLGASNLTRGISTVLATAAAYWGQPLDVLTALGHGRSYGGHSSVLGRMLPGIRDCGLWTALAAGPPAPLAALLTDIGNDLFFEALPEQIVAWVENCLERLAQVEARAVMTRMPMFNLDRMNARWFLVMRSIFFPFSRLTLPVLGQRARELDERLCRLAHERGCRLVEQRAGWYGLDPIHIKLAHWSAAWHDVLGGWSDAPCAAAERGSWREWTYLRLLPPEERWLLGLRQRRVQPSGRLRDGTTISLY